MKKYLVSMLVVAFFATTAYGATDTSSSASSSWSATPAATTTTAPARTSPTNSTTTTTVKPVVTVMPKIVDVSQVANPNAYELYVVVAGDNLSKIADKYDTTWQEIAKLNNISNRPNLIWPGEVFFIPGTAGSANKVVVPEVKPEVQPEVQPITPLVPALPVEQEPETVQPVTPVAPIIEIDKGEEVEADSKELIDGVYVGFNSNYSTTDATDDWDYFVTLYVEGGEITDAHWDAKNETVSTYGKYELSSMGEYGMLEVSKLGVSWAEQADVIVGYLLETQDINAFNVDPSTKKLTSVDGIDVDVTSQASIKVADFVELTSQAIEKAKGNLPATADVDTISSASLTVDADTLTTALSEDGNWLVAGIGDIVVEDAIVIDGTFYKKDVKEDGVYRKFTMSNHVYDADGNRDRTKEEIYVLTAKGGILVESPNTNIVNSVIVGDIVVDAEGFTMSNVTLLGYLDFTTQEYRDSAKFSNLNLPYAWIDPDASTAYNDGVFVGKSEGDDFNDVVTVTIRHGNVAYVEYNALKVEDGVETKVGKKELDAEGKYNLGDDAVATWTEQAKVLEDYVIGKGDLDVDTISGATISVDGFLNATKDALAQAK